MKKNIFKLILNLTLVLLITVLPLGITGCSSKETLYYFTYGDYLNPEVYSLFEEEYGIRVVYDEYAAPEDMYAKFTSGSAKYDLICTSEYMLEKLIGEGRLAEINFDNVENISNINENQLESTRAFDPELKYTVPHFWGTVGILYNTEKVAAEDVKSWKTLFNGKYSGRIVMPNSERDAFFVALKALGYDPNTKNEDELKAAAKLLREQKSDVEAYLLDQAARIKIVSENADLAVVYSGEAYLAAKANEKIAYAIPDEGTCMWLDSLAIPKDAQNKEYAEMFINFLCREDIAKLNFEYIYYTTPNKALIDNLAPEITSNKAMFPDDDVQKKGIVFKYLGTEIEQLYAELWKDIKS